MFAQQWASRKRCRDEDEETGPSTSFSEHRIKRHIASLPHRQSPSLNRRTSPLFAFSTNYASDPAPPTITPANSDSDEKAAAEEPKSFFSPYSSSPTCTITQSDPPTPFPNYLESSQSTQISDAPIYSDDFEMTDSGHLSPGSFHNDPSMSISGRIPTPIHSSFAPFIRGEKASFHNDADFADDEAFVDRIRRGRRLPSPISEGEMSPSVIIDGMGDMQMEVDTMSQPEKEIPTKKGHTRSKHSLRQWTGFGGEMSGNAGMKKSFSMGYRADCEKCRMKVPGHFSHIITY
ncbi:hypothetical protein G7Y89_g2134 [Cudoniella acicularis]|uniref:Uncharacterized protein n=1 Tax=Cudoniella acicularis TaxID=354080 RepID=A0A8H4W8X0_9HELO|nr:hypothetical protein G7Y89_g2134 [Cudoniella acicularis]